jgi:hypothetical protein
MAHFSFLLPNPLSNILHSSSFIIHPKREISMQELENKIRDLQKELAEVQTEQAALRIQPCRGDSEIMAKDVKYDELDRRATIIRKTIWDLTRKRQMLISQSTSREICDPHASDECS